MTRWPVSCFSGCYEASLDRWYDGDTVSREVLRGSELCGRDTSTTPQPRSRDQHTSPRIMCTPQRPDPNSDSIPHAHTLSPISHREGRTTASSDICDLRRGFHPSAKTIPRPPAGTHRSYASVGRVLHCSGVWRVVHRGAHPPLRDMESRSGIR